MITRAWEFLAGGMLASVWLVSCDGKLPSPGRALDGGPVTHGPDGSVPVTPSDSGPGSPDVRVSFDATFSPDAGSSRDSGSPSDTGPSSDADSADGESPDAYPPASDPYECTVPAIAPSGGSCVTLVAKNDAGAGVQCNPVTNEGCSGGASCDIAINPDGNNITGFICYPPPNGTALCQVCSTATSAGPFCSGGLTCNPFEQIDGGFISECTRYCCSNADCGTGICARGFNGISLYGPVAPSLGQCVESESDGGATGS